MCRGRQPIHTTPVHSTQHTQLTQPVCAAQFNFDTAAPDLRKIFETTSTQILSRRSLLPEKWRKTFDKTSLPFGPIPLDLPHPTTTADGL